MKFESAKKAVEWYPENRECPNYCSVTEACSNACMRGGIDIGYDPQTLTTEDYLNTICDIATMLNKMPDVSHKIILHYGLCDYESMLRIIPGIIQNTVMSERTCRHYLDNSIRYVEKRLRSLGYLQHRRPHTGRQEDAA